MTDKPSPTNRPAITAVRLALWSAPFAVSLLVLAVTFAMNWEPWFGFSSVIAGALGSLMLAGQQLQVGGS